MVLSRTPTPHPLLMAKLKKAATKVRGLPGNPSSLRGRSQNCSKGASHQTVHATSRAAPCQHHRRRHVLSAAATVPRDPAPCAVCFVRVCVRGACAPARAQDASVSTLLPPGCVRRFHAPRYARAQDEQERAAALARVYDSAKSEDDAASDAASDSCCSTPRGEAADAGSPPPGSERAAAAGPVKPTGCPAQLALPGPGGGSQAAAHVTWWDQAGGAAPDAATLAAMAADAAATLRRLAAATAAAAAETGAAGGFAVRAAAGVGAVQNA
jgi:hypothetical protein